MFHLNLQRHTLFICGRSQHKRERLNGKQTFSSPVATSEVSKFYGILSAAHSQHRILGFEIAQLEFHHTQYRER